MINLRQTLFWPSFQIFQVTLIDFLRSLIMIRQSPETPMGEPHRTYIEQRAEAIEDVLSPIVGDTNVQLCPRAILPHEAIFSDPAIIYGCVVEEERHGHKTVLYDGSLGHY